MTQSEFEQNLAAVKQIVSGWPRAEQEALARRANPDNLWLFIALMEAQSSLREYRAYGEKMREIGRGFSGTGLAGQSIDSVLSLIETVLESPQA